MRRTLLLLAAVPLTLAHPAAAETAADLVARSIAHHGGDLYTSSEITLDLCSKSGCSALEVRRDGGLYEYCATAETKSGERKVCVDNEGTREWLDGVGVTTGAPPGSEAAAELETSRRDWVMQRVYFAFLPYRLQDPSVRLEDQGTESWDGRELRRIKVTFEPGTSTDAEDEFLYWFDPQTARLELFAYSYTRNDGGLRFRRLKNHRRAGGILFFDQENFGVEGPELAVDVISPTYAEEALRHVSTVELRAIRVDSSACPAVPGIEAALSSARVLLVGELHGTEQSPDFVAAVVCQALVGGRSVTVGLEWAESEVERVEAFLESGGDPEALAALLSGDIWQARGQAQYGATSEAMLALLEVLRELRAGGADVEVVLFNRLAQPPQTRDERMAAALADRITASPDDFFVILTGNIHSRLAPGTPWNPDFLPMGLALQRRLPDLPIRSIDVAHAGGTAWLCISGKPCGEVRQRARSIGARSRWTVSLGDEIDESGHHGVYYVGEITASPPAVADRP